MFRIIYLFFICYYICSHISCKPGTTSPSPPFSRQKPTIQNFSLSRQLDLAFNTQYVQLLILLLFLISQLISICIFYSKRVRYIPLNVARNLLNEQSFYPTWKPCWSPYTSPLLLIIVLLQCDYSQTIFLIYFFKIPVHLAHKVSISRKLLIRLSFSISVITMISQATTQPAHLLCLFVVLISCYKINKHAPYWVFILY